MSQLRWGIMGTGGIAAAMAGTLHDAGSPLVAVGSARPGAAAEFAGSWQIPLALPSHDAVAEQPDVDLVYVASTNDVHHANVLACVANGKPALCEKPLALNLTQAREMLEAGRTAGVLVMEAMWMRFLPFMSTVDRLLDDGAIGEPSHFEASFGFATDDDPTRRWRNPLLGGGTLVDMGVYPLTLAHHLFGRPVGFEAHARLGTTGVDVHTQVISHHRAGSSSITSSFVTDLANEAVIAGREGRLRLHAPFHHTSRVTLERGGDEVETHDTGFAGHGFGFQVAEFERCARAGLVESPVRPHGDTLAVMDWMDAIRARCGIRYPADEIGRPQPSD